MDNVLGGGGEGSSPGVMGISRKASYAFTGDGRFKDAKYTGGWLAGRVHGRSVYMCEGLSLSCNQYCSHQGVHKKCMRGFVLNASKKE